MMLKKFIIPTLLFIVLGGIVFTVLKMTSPRLAYVRSADLVNKYEGMKEARMLYKNKMSKWQSNIDTLESDYQRSISQYNLEYSKQSTAARKDREEILEKQRQNIQQYVKTLDEKAREEDDKMTSGVINQINSFVQQYGEEHHYDFIFGTTQDGNVMYGTKGNDITEEVLTALNKNYTSKSK
ncbi:MAG: outer membrane protein [Chitinophagaceae bacterium]|nr:outer membrane protein [Chitinophagaceae bacterium]